MNNRWPVHTVVLDLDDTLYPESEFVASGIAAVAAWLQREKRVHGFEEWALRLYQAGCRGRIFDNALAELGVVADSRLIGAMLKVYRGHEPRLRLFRDAVEMLPWLHQNFRLALLTDGYADVQKRKVTALGVHSWVQLTVFTDEIGAEFWKPHHAGFERVMECIVGPSCGYVYVADNPQKDFLAPKRMGWRTIHVRRQGAEYAAYEGTVSEQAEISIRELTKLRELLLPIQHCLPDRHQP